MALPAGVLTFVFTDIEGSTRLLRELGPRFTTLLARHDAALRGVWATHGGHEVKTLGDGFLVAFESAQAAVAASVAAQRALAATTWPTELPVRVRVGMHSGFARPADGDYTAMVIHQAARVVGAAHGGQVLVSGDVAEAVLRAGGAPDAGLTPLGRFRVRDFDEPVALWAAAAPELPGVALAPRVRPADGHNLVRPVGPLLGRDDDERAVAELLGAGALVTLTGPGGVGKTRLATEVALDAAPDWADGAWFVDLAPLEAAELVPEALGAAIGAPGSPGVERWTEVLAHLAERQALVVLDNCEQLGAGFAALAAELLAAAPGVALLATSRQPLGLRRERVLRLGALDRDAAVALFLEHGDAEAGELEDVEALCAELDGLPLAIELAAARTGTLAPGDILRRLRRTASVIRSRDPTLPERQRDLERLLDWSWQLLTPAARTVLGRLSVFAAGFDVDAAEAVGAGGDVEADDVAELLWDLRDASLVRLDDAAGATRYRLLSTVRAHAVARADPEDRAAATTRLAARFLERLGPSRASRRSWVLELDLELDNVRACLAHVDSPAAAQALAWSIGCHHDLAEHFATGIAELSAVLAARPEPTPDRVALLALLAYLHLRQAELDRAEEVLVQATALAEEVGCPAWDGAGISRARGHLALRRGDVEEAVALAREALGGGHAPRARAQLSNLLGIALDLLGDAPAAVGAFEAELAAVEEGELETFLARTHANLAEAHLRAGERGCRGAPPGRLPGIGPGAAPAHAHRVLAHDRRPARARRRAGGPGGRAAGAGGRAAGGNRLRALRGGRGGPRGAHGAGAGGARGRGARPGGRGRDGAHARRRRGPGGARPGAVGSERDAEPRGVGG